MLGPIQGYTDGSLLTARYGSAAYITIDGASNLYISDRYASNYHSIRRISRSDQNVTTMAGKTGTNNNDNIFQVAMKIIFLIFFCLFFPSRKLKVCTPTESTYGDGQQWCFEPGGPALPGRLAQFNGNTGLAVNRMGSLIYTADTYDNIVRQLYCEAGILSHFIDLLVYFYFYVSINF